MTFDMIHMNISVVEWDLGLKNTVPEKYLWIINQNLEVVFIINTKSHMWVSNINLIGPMRVENFQILLMSFKCKSHWTNDRRPFPSLTSGFQTLIPHMSFKCDIWVWNCLHLTFKECIIISTLFCQCYLLDEVVLGFESSLHL